MRIMSAIMSTIISTSIYMVLYSQYKKLHTEIPKIWVAVYIVIAIVFYTAFLDSSDSWFPQIEKMFLTTNGQV